MLKMRLVDLTGKIIEDVVKIYDKTVGGHGVHYLRSIDIEELSKTLRSGQPIEWRFGSKVTGHSKLWIHPERSRIDDRWLIYFRFGANIDPGAGENEKLAETLAINFQKEINKYLEQNNLAIITQP